MLGGVLCGKALKVNRLILREGLVTQLLVIHDLPKPLRLGCVLRGLLSKLTLIRLRLRLVVKLGLCA